jgi:hypothetical protein
MEEVEEVKEFLKKVQEARVHYALGGAGMRYPLGAQVSHACRG